MEEEKEVIYTLLRPIKYAQGGEEIEGGFITLVAPSNKQLRGCARLKQAFCRAVSELEQDKKEDAKAEQDAKITGEDCVNLLYASSAEMDKLILEAVELLKSGVALIEGGPPLKQPHVDQMAPADIEGLMGEYLANFILVSLIPGAK